MSTATEGRWIEYVALSDLRPDPRNPKTHHLGTLRESTQRFGFTESLVVDDRTGLLVSGHGRRELLLDDYAAGAEPPEGIRVGVDGAWLVPVTRGWSSRDDDEAYAVIVAANRIGELGGWNDRLLAEGLERLSSLNAEGAGLVGVGYSPDDLTAMLAELAGPPQEPVVLTDPDAIPEPPKKPITKRGDLWLMGAYLVCPHCGTHNDVPVS